MKRFLLAVLLYIGLLFPAFAADRYWVGGTGNWSDNTNHWSATDGGAAGASLPTSADNVFFTAASNATAYTVTVDATAACLDMTWALPSGSGVPTFAQTSALQIYGSLTLVAGMVVSSGATVNFLATSTGKTITTAGVSLVHNITFSGVGGGWTLADTLTNASNCTITVSAGTLNTNAQTVTTGFFVSTSGTRTLTLDGSTINVTGTSGTPWNISTSGTLTFTATGSTINVNGGAAGTALTLNHGNALTYATYNITGAGNWTTGNAFTAAAFSYASTTNKTDSLAFGNTLTISVNGTLSLTGNSTVNRAFVKSSTLGTTRTITISGTTVPTLTNVDFQDVTASGNTPWTGTSLGDCLGNSGITFDASTTQTFNGTGGTDLWSTAARWTSRVPLPQDDVVIPAMGGGSQIVSSDMPRLGRNMDASANSKVWSFSATPNTIFGNIALGASGTYSGTQALTLAGRGSQTITSNGKTFPQAVTVAAFGGTYTLQDNLATSSQSFTTSVGTFDSGAFDVTASSFSTASGATIASSSASTWTSTAASGTPWSMSASAVTTNFLASNKFTGNVVATATFSGGGKTYQNFWWSSTSATGTLALTGANTFRDFKIDGTTARTVTFPASTVTTMDTFTKSNPTAGQLTSIVSSSPGTPATLSDASGTNQLDYMSITDSTATGGATWNACNSTAGAGNTGWNIYAGACPAGSASMLMMMGVSN